MMRFPGVTTGSAGNLALGTVVGAAGSYGSGAVTVGAAAGNWQLNASNYFGFRFVGADGGTKYGWGRFVIGASISGADRTIAEIAYEDSGASINVGTVPAPGAIALLGLAGLAHRRRR
jgi:MYXO-CTERM domain-containing protein